MSRLLSAARAAYDTLLRLGDYEGRSTVEGQAVLANLRDSIALETGSDPETVQTTAEFSAAWRAAQTSAEGRAVVDGAGS